ncbi:MAG: DUF2859 domain-containing protein [Rhodospirillales bacterium]|nr:MAG: DUF2859 domain-containing protein [Rhodospirillales bacterium]
MIMVVQAETRRDLERIAAAAPALPRFAASGAAFAEGLGLRHYPAVIDAAGIRPGP